MRDMTKGPVAGQIISFTMPLLFGNIFQQLYNVTDSLIVGRALGRTALAAVGTSFPVLFLLGALLMGISMGFSVLVSQFYGAREMDRLSRTVDTGYGFGFATSLVITVGGILLANPVLRLLRVPPEVFGQAKVFLMISFTGTVFMFGYNAVAAVLRGLGDARTPLYLLIFSTLLNIGLDCLFVLAFRWGVAGAAWATVISQAAAFGAGLVWCALRKSPARLKLAGFRWDQAIMNKALALGAPTGIQHVLVASGMMVIMSLVNGFGTAVTAGFTAASRLDSFAILPAMSISMAVTTFTGQNIGAGRNDRVGAGLKTALLLITVISIPISVLFIVAGRPLVAFFNTDPAVIGAGVGYFRVVAWFYLCFGVMFTFAGVLRGAGDVFVPMIFSIFTLWIIRIPLSVLLSGKFGPTGIWWALPAAWVLGAVLTTGYYFTGRWKKVAAIRSFRKEPGPVPEPETVIET